MLPNNVSVSWLGVQISKLLWYQWSIVESYQNEQYSTPAFFWWACLLLADNLPTSFSSSLKQGKRLSSCLSTWWAQNRQYCPKSRKKLYQRFLNNPSASRQKRRSGLKPKLTSKIYRRFNLQASHTSQSEAELVEKLPLSIDEKRVQSLLPYNGLFVCNKRMKDSYLTVDHMNRELEWVMQRIGLSVGY